MENIINLVKKDLYTIPLIKKQLLFFCIAFSIASITTYSYIYLMFVLMLYIFFGMNCYYEEISSNDYSILSLPVTRVDYVIAKYLCNLFYILICLIIISIVYIALEYLTKYTINNFSSLFMILSICFILGILFISIQIPMMIKFGFAKARYSIMGFYIIIGIIFSIFTELLKIPKFLSTLSILENNEFLSIIITLLVTLSIFIISLLFSIKIYENKELTN